MPDSAQFMVFFFQNVDLFLLIVIRLLGFFIILPVLSGTSIPLITRILFSVSMAVVVYTSHSVIGVEYYPNIIGYGLLVVEEFIAGFLMALVVYIVFSVLFFAGQLIDMQIGLSMVNILDPITQLQVPIVGNVLFMMIGVMLIQTGGLHEFVSAIFYSYDVMPIGHALILNNGGIVNSLLQLVGAYFVTGVQIAMPMLGSILILDIALGLLVKSVPQMNIFVVGMPIKLLCGLAILYVIIPVFATVYEMLFSQAMGGVIEMLRNLSP